MKTISLHRLLHRIFFFIFGIYICVDSAWRQNSSLFLYVALLLGIFTALISPKRKVKIDGFVVLYIAFAGYVCLSTLWSVDGNAFIGAARVVLKYSIASIILYWNIESVGDIKRLLFIMWLAGMIIALYSIRLYGLNYMFTAIEKGIRLGREIIQINGFGYTTAIAFSLSYKYLIENKRLVIKIMNLLALPLLFLCVLSSGSRRSFIAVFAFIIFYTINHAGKSKKYWKIAFMTLALVVFGYTLIELGILDSIFIRFSWLEEYAKSGTTDYLGDLYRVKLIQLGIQYFIHNPIFGNGANSFQMLNISYFGSSIASHNNVIEILVNYGIIGALFYYGNWIRALKSAYTFRKKSNQAMTLFVMMLSLIFFAEMTAITHIFSMTEYIVVTAASSLLFVVGDNGEKNKSGRYEYNKKMLTLHKNKS